MGVWRECLRNPAACMGRAASSVGRFVQRQGQYVGQRFERAMPQTAARVQDYREERAHIRDVRAAERPIKRKSELEQYKRIREGRERYRDEQNENRIKDAEFEAKYGREEAENRRIKNDIKRLQRQTYEADIHATAREDAVLRANRQKQIREMERSTSPVGYATGFGKFVYDEAKYTAGIDRHKGNPYATQDNSKRPQPGYNKKGRNKKKKGGGGGNPAGWSGNIPGGP